MMNKCVLLYDEKNIVGNFIYILLKDDATI